MRKKNICLINEQDARPINKVCFKLVHKTKLSEYMWNVRKHSIVFSVTFAASAVSQADSLPGRSLTYVKVQVQVVPVSPCRLHHRSLNTQPSNHVMGGPAFFTTKPDSVWMGPQDLACGSGC